MAVIIALRLQYNYIDHLEPLGVPTGNRVWARHEFPNVLDSFPAGVSKKRSGVVEKVFELLFKKPDFIFPHRLSAIPVYKTI